VSHHRLAHASRIGKDDRQCESLGQTALFRSSSMVADPGTATMHDGRLLLLLLLLL